MAEVGIGTNLAFSVIHSFRNHLFNDVEKHIQAAAAPIVSVAKEWHNSQSINMDSILADIRRAGRTAETWVDRVRGAFTVTAIASAFVLFLVLIHTARNATTDCPESIVWLVAGLGTVPVTGRRPGYIRNLREYAAAIQENRGTISACAQSKLGEHIAC